MNKKLKIYTALAALISYFLSFAINKNTKAEISSDNINIVLDSLSHNNILPKRFRKTTDLLVLNKNNSLNLKGLDRLNISASKQFSEYNLPSLIKAIDTSLPITIVDLRQESHGFINGLAVSWNNFKNNVNKGLTREEVLQDESNKLNSLKLNADINFHNNHKKTIMIIKVQDENELVKSKYISYNRITVKDGGIPSDDMVDYFMDFLKSQKQNLWLHFHCKAGVGRTTTFMIMYDMIKNYKEVSADDIINRQLILAKFDDEGIKSFKSKRRSDFFNKFYYYCKTNGPSFRIKWSKWKVEERT
ncbi:fused DSP-PTPase phosphatase/NAD kinase-like protein [Clostridium saccharobutylicum]|uniref:Effector protein hopD2 n=1 Tax=Clostridium saccharobutylicum TaxID=169679 RepID=A0A1S8N1Z4_CLOSA|nr:protein-tyrosine phosphatase family protein [Clostridium saccharobutylicum]OOM10455.1 effector protein hopD2 [Clostridium saccharobutylicum]